MVLTVENFGKCFPTFAYRSPILAFEVDVGIENDDVVGEGACIDCCGKFGKTLGGSDVKRDFRGFALLVECIDVTVYIDVAFENSQRVDCNVFRYNQSILGGSGG